MEYLPDSRITCIDPFYNTEGRFDSNVTCYGDRVRKLKGKGVPILFQLEEEKQAFDLVYIDGDHRRQPTFAHSVLSWPLLKVGGILIWDDWKWELERPSSERPEHAVDLFCTAFAPCLKTLHKSYQVAVEKTGEWPDPEVAEEPKAATCLLAGFPFSFGGSRWSSCPLRPKHRSR